MFSISKQLTCQKYIYKIHSSRLRKAKWKLTLPLSEARRNDEMISIADSQVLRWIDQLNGLTDADGRAREIKEEIRQLRKQPTGQQTRQRIRELYAALDAVQYKPDYMCLIIDRERDYHRARKGFFINGVKYRRLLGTNGGIKNSTIVFVSERLWPELNRRIENDRNPDMPIVTAKLEAYKALSCSASTPVSLPRGIIIVNDCTTKFRSDIIYLTDEHDGEPEMERREQYEIELDASDGYGIMLPSLAERWSKELGLDYTVSGCNTRFCWEKGMVFPFDFVEFAEEVAGGYIIRDAWGKEQDVRNAELILTTSMVKLWDSYDSCEDYLSKTLGNGYTFGIAKTCPKELESERSLNYQFIQSHDLSDADIRELIEPTMNEIRDVLGGDWRETVLFLKGSGLTEDNVDCLKNDIAKAVMIDRRMIQDPFIRNTVYQLIRNRINEAKVGVLKVHGNYSIVSGDPYALCQSMFGLEVTGLLKAGEIYNQYWSGQGSERLACFRAPMTCHNNIKLVHPANREDVNHWYRHMKTCTVFNAWDTTAAALNGMDFDGDLVMLTDNRILVERHRDTLTLMCAQRRASKCIPSEDDFVRSNIDSFGNDIGQTTNWITSMFEVQSHFAPGTREYETLAYRIMCGQQFQQNAIDKAKGIVCKPMPREWHDRHAVMNIEDEAEREFYRSIVADKKPYFMRYIYPQLMRQYNTYITNTNKNAQRRFQMNVEEMMRKPAKELTEEQLTFLRFYKAKLPVGVGDCVMNRICRAFEEEFDGFVGKSAVSGFDYEIMRSDAQYSSRQFYRIKQLYEDFNRRVKNYAAFTNYERVDDAEAAEALAAMCADFQAECAAICPDRRAMGNIILDICYTKSSTKAFAWKVCAGEIIQNLLEKQDHMICFPTRDPSGDILYGGERFRLVTKRIEGDEI